jgi:hypothetical protein
MNNITKNLLAALVINLFAVAGMHAWTNNFYNQTASVLNVEIKYSLCKDQSVTVQPNSSASLSNGVCCASAILVQCREGVLHDQKLKITPPSTGASISCRNNDFTVMESADHTLMYRTGRP